MQRDLSFERQLNNLEHESQVIANYVYAEMGIQHAASKSRRLLNQLNETPTFWIACTAALQSAAYISLGRVFDLKSRYNLAALLDSMEANLSLFQREGLASRKRENSAADPAWLPDYLNRAYYPTQRDVVRLRKAVQRYREIYERAVMPARHQYLAHRQAHGHEKIQELFGRGKTKEMWRLTTFLVRLHLSLRELLINGRKPILRPIRYSVRAIFASASHRSGPHEYVMQDVKRLMMFLETASTTPNETSLATRKRARAPERAR
jgi:hypothetical protein